MKKIIWIVAGLVVLGVVLQQLLSSDLQKILRNYDKALVEYQEQSDYTSAYYELNQTFNRLAAVGVSSLDRPLYSTKQIGWLEKQLKERVDTLLTKLDRACPAGIENDRSSTRELRKRYHSFFQKRIAVLNRDKDARKQTELVVKTRGITAPERLPEKSLKNALGKSDKKPLAEPAAKTKGGDIRQQQAQEQKAEMMKKAAKTD